jgi:hypothetical protein
MMIVLIEVIVFVSCLYSWLMSVMQMVMMPMIVISIRGHQHQIALCGTTHIDSLMTYLVIMIVMMMMMIDDDDAGDNG